MQSKTQIATVLHLMGTVHVQMGVVGQRLMGVVKCPWNWFLKVGNYANSNLRSWYTAACTCTIVLWLLCFLIIIIMSRHHVIRCELFLLVPANWESLSMLCFYADKLALVQTVCTRDKAWGHARLSYMRLRLNDACMLKVLHCVSMP
jgi:hypothetical protein